MEKVLFLMSRLPYPANDGRSVTLLQYLESMKNDYEIAVISLACEKDINNQPSYLSFVDTLEYPKFAKKILNVFTLSFFGGTPLQVSAVYSKKAQKKFNRLVKEFKPDIIICDMIRTSRFVLKCKYECKRILDMDDVLSNRYKTSIKAKEDPLGQFKDMLPSFALKMIKIFHLKKFLLKFESRKIRKLEIKLPKKFDMTVLVSPIECEKLKKDSECEKIIFWPVCMNSVGSLSSYDSTHLCFLGNMNASQNQSTLTYICEKILPLLPNNFVIDVVGKCNDEIKNNYSAYNNVSFTGFVESTEPYVANCLCLLAPIQYGSGIKIKVLEAMSYGVPVITSEIGIEGLNIIPGEDILVSKNEEDYRSAIMSLQDPSLRNKIAKKGLEYLKNNHSFDYGKEIVLSSLNSLKEE